MRSSPYSSVPAKVKLSSENISGIATTKILICGPVSTYWLSSEAKLSAKQIKDVLSPEELTYADSLSSKTRKDEFLRARWLFHKSFKNAGPLVPGKNGLSNWPEGWVGSISHKNGHVVLAKAQKASHQSLGIDIEALKPIKSGFESKICSTAEQELVETYLRDPKLDRSDLYLMIFSAKESLFKTHFPLGLQRFDFLDVEVVSMNFIRREMKIRLLKDTSGKTKKDQMCLVYYCHLPSSDNGRYIVTSCEEKISVAFTLDDEGEEEPSKDDAKAEESA